MKILRLAVLLAAAVLVVGADRARAEVLPGEILVAEMNCTACHAASPELTARLAPRTAPRLAKDGVRISPQWIRAFLTDPQKSKPGTLMPDTMHGMSDGEKASAADALTHFLVSLQPAPAQAASTAAANVEEGRALYHRIGCVQCHAPEVLPPGRAHDEAALADLAALQSHAVPLGEPSRKYTRAALAGFLLDPLRSRPSGRMPAMNLTPAEADALAVYLLRDGAGEEPSFIVDAQKAKSGAELFASLRCADCHTAAAAGIAEAAKPPAVRPFEKLRQRQPSGCISARPKPSAPKFELTDRQRTVILVTLQSQDILQMPLAPEQQVRRTMTALNCYACHSRDRRGGADGLSREYFDVLSGDRTDEARIPPTLTGIGARLDAAALRAALLAGARTRPQMATRMPVYGEANVSHLLPLLATPAK